MTAFAKVVTYMKKFCTTAPGKKSMFLMLLTNRKRNASTITIAHCGVDLTHFQCLYIEKYFLSPIFQKGRDSVFLPVIDPSTPATQATWPVSQKCQHMITEDTLPEDSNKN